MTNFFRRIFSRRRAEPPDQEALRAEFRSRYHHFQQLLTNDREVHERLVDIEQALRGEADLDMRFVRRVVTRAITGSFQVIKHLTALAPGRYDGLKEPFKAIQANILPHIEVRRPPGSGPLTMDLAEVTRGHSHLTGPKMACLGEAARALPAPIPAGFVITAESYYRFIEHGGLKDEILRRIQAADLDEEPEREETLFQLASSLQQLIIDAPLPAEVEAAILEGLDRLGSGPDLRVAMRSSAMAEDQADAAFAGQYKSKLNVSRDEALLSYKVVVASKYGRQAMSYRFRKGLRAEDQAMCVGVLRMVQARAGGVAYSADPIDPADDRVAVHATWGLPKTVVDGSADTDLFRFARGEEPMPVERVVAHKATRFECRPDEGTCRLEVEAERADAPCLSEAEARRVAALALALERHFGTPQDMEWALDEHGEIILLQTRALPRPAVEETATAQAVCAAPEGEPLLEGGATASPGTSAGPAYPARTQADLLLFPDGGILVVRQALPSWAPLMHRAGGIISEMGSAAGHLANVAREFGVPALFGLKGAVKALEPGREITLDASGAKVWDGLRTELLSCLPGPRNPLKGSAVHQVLRRAARHILPLHLLDPDGMDFKPANCRSLHDVIRFCHEQSVREMFAFGRDRNFPQAAAKQLDHGGPKQFWILNLDDGFKREVDGPLVHLSDIASVPMLALWEGMNAVPWEGPPPMNTRGFMAVMFEATANTSLEPSMSSHYSQKNYFMISRHFASLQSRFGFHFCGAEALVGERDSENYAGFQFRGGAADRQRRVLRARLIADLLQERDFRVRVRGDGLTARVEGFDQARMERRLRALGYLIIHTRQLDMIMADRAEAERRRRALSEQIGRFFS